MSSGDSNFGDGNDDDQIKETDLYYTARATKGAWNDEYKGDLADVLRESIADYLSKDKTPYARLTTIVNSSGTGKSRMVDQLATETITVPMCIRRAGRDGFPPADGRLRDWFVPCSYNRRSVRNKLHGFTYSLLKITLSRLETIATEQDIPRIDEVAANKLYNEMPTEYMSLVVKRQKMLASAFREYMTKGQTYHTTNPNRRSFYLDVINTAEQYVSKGESLRKAGEMLCRFIDQHGVLESDEGPRPPLVVLAFDEADTLTDNPPEEEHWDLFSEMCEVLRQIGHLPIFSLFISTAARFKKFSPMIRYDPSALAREPDNHLLEPISEVSFDDIAYPALKGTITIHDAVTIYWISHLGRPLFGSYWDNLPRIFKTAIEVMDYAKQKLLCGPSELRDGNWGGSLACLSIRFALEFNTNETTCDVTFALVERHMRLCIAATSGFENMITISGSEPLLAEAAYELIKGTQTNAVRHLVEHRDLNCIYRGRRGELVAALLIMQTYDAARVFSGKRWVSVVNFMEALLPPLKYNALLRSAPSSWPTSHHNEATFEAIFKDYGMWFNHIIRVEQNEMISIDHLWKFVTRGAMILCATNQEGIDIVLPVCDTTRSLGPDSVTAIIVQVKNTKDYTATLDGGLFDRMDSVAMFSELPEPGVDPNPGPESTPAQSKKKVVPKPVIRLVFALASPEPAVVFRDRPKIRNGFDGFTTFDIWLAGLSDETYGQIEDRDLVHYQILLERSLAPHDAFELKDDQHMGKEAKKLRGDRRRKMVPLPFPEDAHHSIHRVDGLGEGSGGQPGEAIRPLASPEPGPSDRKKQKTEDEH